MQKLRIAIKKYLKTVDKWLLVFCVFLSTLSVLLLYSLYQSDLAQTLRLTERTCIVQLAAMFLGLGAAVIISNIDYHFIVKLWKLYIPISVFLVVLTFFVGLQVDESVDDKAWLRLPFGLTFQPSELLKICFIMSFAYHLSKVRSEINKPLNVLLLCAHGAFPILLIHFQGDDGTAIVFAFIFMVMLFAAGIDWKYILAGIALLAVAVPIAWQYLLTDDQRGALSCPLFFRIQRHGCGRLSAKPRTYFHWSGSAFGQGAFSEGLLLRSDDAQRLYLFVYRAGAWLCGHNGGGGGALRNLPARHSQRAHRL